jgi:FkbM family methyltransferase
MTLYYPSQSRIGRVTARGQGWDTVLRPVLGELVAAERPLIVEVGANIGASLLQMHAAKPHARFVCFEPSPRFRRLLERTIAANGWDVAVEPAMLGSSPGSRVLFTNATTASTLVSEYDRHELLDSRSVPVTTLDVYFENRGSIDFLKIDTDGFDYDVLLGGRELLGRDRPAIFFELEPDLTAQAGHRPEDVIAYLQECGYEDFLVLSNFGEALTTTRAAAEVLALAHEELYVDVVGVHSSEPDAPARLRRLEQTIGVKHSIRPGRRSG